MAHNSRVNEKNTKLNSVRDWQDAIRLGIRYRNMYGQSNLWPTYKNYYRGYFRPGTVPVNIVYSIGRSLIPQIYFRDPRIKVTPARPGFGLHARMLTRIDNLLIREMGLKRQLKSMILNSYLCGRAPGILGFDSEYGFDPTLAAEEIDGFSEGQHSKKFDAKIEYNSGISGGMPWFSSCSPTDYVVPWGTKDINEAPWFAFRKMRMLRDVKADPKYDNTAKLKGSFFSRLQRTEEGGERKGFIHEDFKSEWVELWQVHDKRSGKVFVLTFNHERFLRNEFDELQIDGLPTEVLGFNEDPDFFWWPPDVRMILQQQLELNDIRTMSRAHRRVALLKVLYDKQAIDRKEMEKLLDGNPKVAVAVDAGSLGDIRKAVAFLQSHVPPDLSIAAREVREDVREIIGFSRNQSGSFEAPSGRRTATEAEIVKAASLIRVDERRDIMADLMVNVMRKVNQLIFKNWTGDRVVDIIGENGTRYWVNFTGPQLRGEFSHKLNPEESMPTDQRVRQAQKENFMNLAAKIPGMDIKYLTESYADEFDWIDPKLLFPSEGPGRSPEKAVDFNTFAGLQQGAKSSFPALGG